jgi:hypothetical protein
MPELERAGVLRKPLLEVFGHIFEGLLSVYQIFHFLERCQHAVIDLHPREAIALAKVRFKALPVHGADSGNHFYTHDSLLCRWNPLFIGNRVRKKKRAAQCLRSPPDWLEDSNVRSLQTLRSLDDFEFDSLTVVKRLIPL